MNPVVVLFKFRIASDGVFSLFCVNGSGSLAVLLFLLGSSETHYHADVRDMLQGRRLKLNLNCTNTFIHGFIRKPVVLPATSLPSRTIVLWPQITGTVIYLMTHEAVFTPKQCVCVCAGGVLAPLFIYWIVPQESHSFHSFYSRRDASHIPFQIFQRFKVKFNSSDSASPKSETSTSVHVKSS